jgi:hypothetical protein
MAADLAPVEVHLGVHVDAVELDGDPLAAQRAWERERLAVPAEAALEEAGPGRGVAGLGGHQLDAPVVRERHAPPGRVVEVRVRRALVGAGRIGGGLAVDEREPPAGVERTAARRRLRGRGGDGDRRRDDGAQRARSRSHLILPSGSLPQRRLYNRKAEFQNRKVS